MRLFKLSRIKKITPLPSIFDHRGPVYTSSEQSWEEPHQIEVKIEFNGKLKHMVEDYFEQATITDQQDGSLLVETMAPSGPWLLGMILSYGEHAELVAPETMRVDLRNQIDRMQSVYQKKSKK